MMAEYYNVKIGLKDKGRLLTLDQLEKLHIDDKQDAYISIYRYNDGQKKQAEKNGTISGIKDVITNSLVWDFDDKANPEQARLDAVELGHRLVDTYNVDPDTIRCFFSGNKGLHVVLPIGKDVTPDQFKKVTAELAKDLQTFDSVVSDPARVLRLEHTRHQETGLYKIPLHISEVDELNIDQIKEMAEIPRDDVEYNMLPAKLPESLFKIEEKKKDLLEIGDNDFDYSNPPKGWKKYKWALAQGHFNSGERHSALMVLAATCRALGYDKESTYYLCKSSLKKQARRTGQSEFTKEELWTNIIEDSVFSDNWEGGQYSPKTNPWLKQYCERMGFDTNEKEESIVIDLSTWVDQFIDYSTNFEQNIIKTGIADLDNHIIFSTSTLNGVLGQPGAGKTSVAIEYLKNASLNGVPSMFFSLDMGPPLVFSKLVQKEINIGFKDVLKLYRENITKRDQVSKLIKEKYRNVSFSFRCGLTVPDMRNAILEQQDKTGVKPKLIVIDYLENVSGPYSDPTANAGMITNQLKDLATELEVCVVLLLQTQKHSTPDISDPLLSMKQIKGSSAIEQNCSTVLTIWREGYNPNTVNDDKYISFALVKSRFGPLGKWDYSWDPIKGQIRTLSEEEYGDLEDFKKRKKQERINKANEDREWQ